MKLFKIFMLIFVCNIFTYKSFGQANPTISVLPDNSGLVAVGSELNLQITIGNTGTASIVANKLRPIITVPSIVTILPNAQQPTLPAGWSIVSNTGTQIRICNGSDVIAGGTFRNIVIKVQGVSVGGPSTFSGQLNFGGSSCAISGPQPTGNTSTDDNSSSSVTVFSGCNLAVSATSGNILCNGGTTIITATPSNAPGPVEYKISGNSTFQTSNVFTVNAAGSPYTITAREVANPNTCIATTTINVTEPLPLLAPVVNITQPTCSTNTGLVTVTSSTTNLVYSIDGSSFASYNSSGYTLLPGTHVIQVKNANNCTSSITFNINNQPITPSALIIGAITQPNCTVSNGAVSLSGLPTGNWVLNPGSISGNTTTTLINNLAPGIYNFTVTNSEGCTSSASNAVVINTVSGAPLEPVINIVQPTCTVATGSFSIIGPTAGLLYSLDGSLFSVYPTTGFSGIVSGPHTLIAQNSSGCLSPITNFVINAQPLPPSVPSISVVQPTCTVATGILLVTSSTSGLTFSLNNTGSFTAYPIGGYSLIAGIYNIAVQNGNGCTPTLVNNIVVNTQPASPTGLLTATPITCFGNISVLTIVGSGGVLPYEYSLNNGPFQTSNMFTASAGSHTVTLKDANGCTGNSNNLNVVQPNAIAASLTAGSILCFNNTTTLTVLATGGVGAFEYSLNNGTYQASNIFNVAAGSHSVRVRLIANASCFATTTSLVISQPSLLKSTAKPLPIYKCGEATTIKIEATGGKLPYTGIGTFTKGPGKWNFIVTDANGCTSNNEVIILPPACIDLKAYPNPTQNNITINHSEALANSTIEIFSINGSKIFSKNISVGSISTNIDLSKFSSETYVLVFNNSGDRKEIKILKSNSK